MAKKDEGVGVLSKVGIVVCALALVPALMTLSYLNDDSALRAETKAERLAVQEEKNRQLVYDEINRRLGNK